MGFSARDVVLFTQARAHLCELADQAKHGVEKIITKNGGSYVALTDANRLDYYHRLECERIRLLLIDDVKRGVAYIEAGRTYGADAAIAQLQQRRAAVTADKTTKKRGGESGKPTSRHSLVNETGAAMLSHTKRHDRRYLHTVRAKVVQRTGNRQQLREYGALTGGALVLLATRR